MSTGKILAITGANGYLGQETIKEALRQGWEVNAIVRREEVIDDMVKLGAKPFITKNFNVLDLANAFANCKAVIHFANIVCGSKKAFENVNVEGMTKITEAAVNAGVNRVIYPSGLGISRYGEEDWATNEYFHSKMQAESILIESGISYVIFRPSYILGPNDELVPELIEQINDGIVYIAGDGTVPMQPIYVKNATKAFIAAAEGKGKSDVIYKLVGPETINMNILVELIFNEIKELGLNIPEPTIHYISYEEAMDKLEICKEMVDVMRCNLISDGYDVAHHLEFELSPLKEAINDAVKAKLTPENSLYSKKKAIILLSGGIDSVTALYWALNEKYSCHALTFDYKWRPKREINAAELIASRAGVKLTRVEIPFMYQATDLRFEGFPIPSATHAPEGFMPYRNLIFYSIAAYYADLLGFNTIIGGHLKEDAGVFSDANAEFFKALEDLIMRSKHENDNTEVRIILPFEDMNKEDVVKLAYELKVPLELTWSCYGDFEQPCEKCTSCRKRDLALLEYQKSNKN